MGQGGGKFGGVGKQTIGSSPIRDVYISPLVFEDGMGEVVISRDLPDGNIAMVVFLVDAYCLGVKNTFLTICSQFKYDEGIEKMRAEGGLDAAEPSYARRLIEGAVEYARDLGFKPHRDYRDARLILGDIIPDKSLGNFSFGKDGKPLYINGPDDSRQRINHILSTLEDRCGKDGFIFYVKQEEF